MQLVVGKLVKVDDIQFVTNIDQFLVHCTYARAHNDPKRANPVLSLMFTVFFRSLYFLIHFGTLFPSEVEALLSL